MTHVVEVGVGTALTDGDDVNGILTETASGLSPLGALLCSLCALVSRRHCSYAAEAYRMTMTAKLQRLNKPQSQCQIVQGNAELRRSELQIGMMIRRKDTIVQTLALPSAPTLVHSSIA